MPSGPATYAAVASTVAVVFGAKWAELSRARRDLDGVKSALQRARQALAEAWWAFVAMSVVVAVVVVTWLHAKH